MGWDEAPQESSLGSHELLLKVVGLVADKEPSPPDIVRVPEFDEKEGIARDNDGRPEGIPLLLVVPA